MRGEQAVVRAVERARQGRHHRTGCERDRLIRAAQEYRANSEVAANNDVVTARVDGILQNRGAILAVSVTLLMDHSIATIRVVVYAHMLMDEDAAANQTTAGVCTYSKNAKKKTRSAVIKDQRGAWGRFWGWSAVDTPVKPPPQPPRKTGPQTPYVQFAGCLARG